MANLALVLAGAAGGFVAGGLLAWWVLGRGADDEAAAGALVRPGSEGDALLDQELERARRYERPFALLHLPSAHEADGGPLTEGALRVIAATLRGIDTLWTTPRGVTILLPEVGRTEAERCLRRLAAVEPWVVDEARIAAFPVDGLTRGALLEQLHGDEEAVRVDVAARARSAGLQAMPEGA